jgi:hypothetical protein
MRDDGLRGGEFADRLAAAIPRLTPLPEVERNSPPRGGTFIRYNLLLSYHHEGTAYFAVLLRDGLGATPT